MTQATATHDESTPDSSSAASAAGTVPAASVLELADGTRLVPEGKAKPSRLDGDRDHIFTLDDVQREGAEPFAGYVRLG